MNNLITFGNISLLGIVGALAYLVINKLVDTSSERHMRMEKETEERLNDLIAVFNPFLIELDRTNFMSVSFINTEMKKHDSVVQTFRIRSNRHSLNEFNTKYAGYKKKTEEYTIACLEATARVMSGLSLDTHTDKTKKIFII